MNTVDHVNFVIPEDRRNLPAAFRTVASSSDSRVRFEGNIAYVPKRAEVPMTVRVLYGNEPVLAITPAGYRVVSTPGTCGPDGYMELMLSETQTSPYSVMDNFVGYEIMKIIPE
ncbi:hypothetical protein AHFPHNDE_01110 [Pseudomonas sp. MM227]|nr:hypothetical protein [Pseudomonas sp. MM227]CAI3787446.1 hypothetical protein AHFPHNDE_01110 [Pseudomonas sp. MM227]